MSSNNRGQGQSGNQMSKGDASRVQSTQVRLTHFPSLPPTLFFLLPAGFSNHTKKPQANNGRDTGKGSFSARAQGAGDRNANANAGANTGNNGQAGDAKK